MSDYRDVCTGPPLSASSQRQRILEQLRLAGSAGILASQLYSEPSRFGRSPRNRISELRKMGHKISGKWESRTDFRYRLIEETPAPKALPNYNVQKRLDWYEQQTGRKRPGSEAASFGPLFDRKDAA